jgi:hypothetical protein
MKVKEWFSHIGWEIKDWFGKKYNRKSVYRLLFWMGMLLLSIIGMKRVVESPNADVTGTVKGVVIAKAQTACDNGNAFAMAVHPTDSIYVDFSNHVDYITYLNYNIGDTIVMCGVTRSKYDPTFSECGNAAVQTACIILVLLFIWFFVMICISFYNLFDDLFDF